MSDTAKHNISRIARIAGISLAGIVGLLVILICIATFYLSPSRLERIINKEASENLNAEVRVSNPQFKIWSTFPHLKLEVDSVKVISRSLKSLPDSLRRQLPDNSDFLMSSGKLNGDVNILKLLKGEIRLGNVTADAVNLNMVMVSDSIANFYILKSDLPSGKIPYFTAKEIALTNPGAIRFYSHLPNVNAQVNLKTLSAVRDSDNYNLYNADINGNLDLTMGGSKLLSQFPFHLLGPANIDFNPMSVKLSDFNIDLGKLKGITNLAMVLENEPKIESLDYNLLDFPISSALSLLPTGTVRWPDALKADPVVGLSARLTSPYSLAADYLPSIEAEVRLPAGELQYQEEALPLLCLGYSPIEAKLAFDGKNPEAASVQLLPFSVNGEGAEVSLNPNISDLATDPHVLLEINGKYDASSASKFFSALSKYAIKGEIEGIAKVDLRKSDIDSKNLQNVIVDADLSIKNYSSKIPEAFMTISGHSLNIDAEGDIKNITFKVTADNFSLSKDKDINVSLKDFNLDGKVTEGTDSSNRRFDMTLTSGNFMVSSGVEKITINDLTSTLSALYSEKGIPTTSFIIPQKWNADNSAMSFARHGDQYLTMALPAKFTNVIKHWKPELNLKIKSGTIATPVMPLHNDFNDLNIQASFDDIILKSLEMSSQDTRLSLNAKVSDLRRFLTSRTPVPLNLDLNLNVDTVFINQLAGAYNHGLKYTHGPSASFLTVIPDTLTASDTITMLLPRNINANINANIMMTSYTNLHLYNLGTGVTLKDGLLKVKDLRVDSDFGALDMDFTYDTSDISHLAMGLTGGLSDVELVNFFSNFHTLLLMMPQMKNIQGNFSLSADAKMQLFPNMYINLPSLWADIYVRGSGLTLHQDPFIRRLTKLMLIHSDNDLHIANLNIHGSIHDNLMELYPFNIDFDRYRLKFGGINNLNGDMYYHLGIDKSPIPFPFGVNLVGNLSHPKFRLGGASFSVKDGEKISNSVMVEKKANLLLELKCLVREMLAKAAEADTTPTSSYVY
ncbi:MAG: AsmA-like C-terminal region-containing protein [Muribaculaceae bacterium]|nr:AsmA-like C-terminal region-containing protein [Muribaculaceae bacterium]